MESDFEYFCHFLTLLIKQVNSGINEGKTYDIIYQMMADLESESGVSLEDAELYGKAILKTVGKKTDRSRLN